MTENLYQWLIRSLLLLNVSHVYALNQLSIEVGQLQIDDLEVSDVLLETSPSREYKNRFVWSGRANLQNITFHANGYVDNRQWKANVSSDLAGGELIQLQQILGTGLPGAEISGDTHLSIHATGNVDHILQGATFNFSAKQWTAEIPDMAVAMEQANFQIQGDVALKANQTYRGNAGILFESGLYAFKDFILEPTRGAIQFSSNYSYSDEMLLLRNGRLHDPGGLTVHVPVLRYDQSKEIPLTKVEIEIEQAVFPYVYSAWAQGLLYGTLLAAVETDGLVQGKVNIENSIVNDVNLALKDFSLSDKKNRFALYKVNGKFVSEKDLQQGSVSIKWDAAEIYRLDIGETELGFKINESNAVLDKPFSVPLYDGELKVFQINLNNIAKEDMSILFDGVLTPVSLTEITTALGWPKFSGTLSGVIPGIHYRKGHVSIDGILLARAFDGTLKIHHLDIENLLGLVPYLSASVELDNIDLQSLTSTFDFGRIEGRLSGYVKDLQMVDWKPSQFDAFFFTPEGDKSRHRISQRAVDNITSLSGSDISSVLSRTYLRFLDNFRYDKLGIGCILKNNVCQMRGIEPTSETGYYIVKAGLMPPRMDIIGYSTSVDWQELVSRLQRVTSDKTPLIQ